MFQAHLRADFLERIVRAIRGFTVSQFLMWQDWTKHQSNLFSPSSNIMSLLRRDAVFFFNITFFTCLYMNPTALVKLNQTLQIEKAFRKFIKSNEI